MVRLGKAHFAALQATFGDDRIKRGDGRRSRSGSPIPRYREKTAGRPAASTGSGGRSKTNARLKPLKKTRNVFFAAMHCHAMNVTL
jgi:hypothetical protein